MPIADSNAKVKRVVLLGERTEEGPPVTVTHYGTKAVRKSVAGDEVFRQMVVGDALGTNGCLKLEGGELEDDQEAKVAEFTTFFGGKDAEWFSDVGTLIGSAGHLEVRTTSFHLVPLLLVS